MTRLLEIGPGRYAHASGALWLRDMKTLLIADTHLGYGWAQRRRGDLGPVVDNRSEPRLLALLKEMSPQRVVVLGDLVHAPHPAVEERTAIERAIASIRNFAELILVRGNHDRAFARDFHNLCVPIVDEWTANGLLARHGDRISQIVKDGMHVVVGHLHPVIMFRDAAGAKQRMPVVLTNSRATVLPAFSPFSAGCDVMGGLPSEMKALFGADRVAGFAVSGSSIAPIGRPVPVVRP